MPQNTRYVVPIEAKKRRRLKPPHHCQPSDYMAMIVWLQQVEAGEVSCHDVDWRTRAGVLARMLVYVTRPTDASVDAFLAHFAKEQASKLERDEPKLP